MYNQWATAPGRSLNYPRPKSITHLRTFSDNGVYVALQLFLVIVVSDQWRRVLIPYSYRQAPWGLLHARGWLSRYTWDQRLYVVSEPRETHSPMLKARFLHLTNFGSSRDRTHDLLTTRPTCYHSATAYTYYWYLISFQMTGRIHCEVHVSGDLHMHIYPTCVNYTSLIIDNANHRVNWSRSELII